MSLAPPVPSYPFLLPVSFKVSLTLQGKHFYNKHLSLLPWNIHQEVHTEILQDHDP